MIITYRTLQSVFVNLGAGLDLDVDFGRFS